MPCLLLQTSRRDWHLDLPAHTVLSIVSPSDRAKLFPQSLYDLIQVTVSWSSSAKLVIYFAFPCLDRPKSFHRPWTSIQSDSLRGQNGSMWSLPITCSCQDHTVQYSSPSWRRCTELWYWPMMSGCRDRTGLPVPATTPGALSGACNCIWTKLWCWQSPHIRHELKEYGDQLPLSH